MKTREKMCISCEVFFPSTTDFFYIKGSSEALDSRCHDCARAEKRKYRENNKDKVRSQERARYYPGKDKIRNKKYDQSNPEKAASRRRKRRAQLSSTENEDYSVKQVLFKYGSTCYLCDKEINLLAPRKAGKLGWEQGLHIDHYVPIFLGGTDTLDNIRPTHGVCNLRKGKKRLI